MSVDTRKRDFHSDFSPDTISRSKNSSPLSKNYSEKLSQAKTSLRPVDFCFENDTEVCHSLGLIKLRDCHSIKIF